MPAVSVQVRLEAELGVTPGDLGLDADAYAARWTTWLAIAAEDALEPKQQLAVVKALLLRSWITALIRKADEFEAVGDIKRKSDMLGRVAVLKADLDVAQALALPPVPAPTSAAETFGPLIGEWGVMP